MWRVEERWGMGIGDRSGKNMGNGVKEIGDIGQWGYKIEGIRWKKEGKCNEKER